MSKVETLTVRLVGKESDEISLDSFVKVVAAMRGLLTELDERHALKWQVTSASHNSPLEMTIGTVVEDKRDSQVLDRYVDVIRTVIRQKEPPGVTRTGINYARSIVNVVSNDSVSHVDFESPGRESVTVWPKQKQSAQEKRATPQAEYSSYAELTGILEVATTENGETAFFVRDRVKPWRFRCDVSRELFNAALEAMKRPMPRVAVYGKVYYRDDRPYRMKVESFKVLPSLEEHPGLFAVQGIDITGGMDSVVYVRGLRDGT